MSRPSSSGVTWHRPSDLACGGAPSEGGAVPGPITNHLAPQLRGRVTPRVLEALEARGLRVHRIGAAAYVHGPGHHLLLGAWPRGTVAPAWADRLGHASAGYVRRLERAEREQHGATYLRDDRGRFLVRLPWWRQPAVRAYAWDPEPLSWIERERRRADAHNRAVLVRRGILRELER